MSWPEINSKIDALNTQKELIQNKKSLEKSKGNSFQDSVSNVANQLNKVKQQQKSFQRNIPNSMDQLINLIGKTQGNGSQTFQYLRRLVLQSMVKMDSKVQQIVIEETIKTLGCSQEQTFKGTTTPNPNLPLISQIPFLPASEGIYIPVNSIDFLGNLKIEPNSVIGKLFYEQPEPSVNPVFKPYGGNTPYPFNKMLGLRTIQNPGYTYGSEFGNFYNGQSQQNLFDISYTQTNELGVSGDFFRVFLLDRNGSQTNQISFSGNQVGQFLKDYYSTIKIIEPTSVIASLMNQLSGFINIKSGISYKQLSDKSKFDKIITRILGLCNDDRKEIDVAGTAKIGEFDGVDDSFFEFNEVDLRQIDEHISNTYKGIVKFESCGEIELPVNVDNILDEMVEFSNLISGQTPQQTVQNIEKIIDTFAQNPAWKPLVPSGVDVNVDINKKVIKNLPLAVVSSVLTPKVLLPIFVLLKATQNSATNTVNNQINNANNTIQQSNTLIGSANTFIQASLQTGTTFGQIVDNIIDDAVDFLKKFKEFCISTVQKISEIFIKQLYEVLKKDILNLLNVVIMDIQKSEKLKFFRIVLRLAQLVLIVVKLIDDYKRCKSLVDGILNLLRLISSVASKGNKIPTPLLFLTQLLPGTSPERASLNVIEGMQRLGLPTGPMPDGSPNLMNVFMDTIINGIDKEEAENGTVDAVGVVNPLKPGLVEIFGKSR